MPMPTVAPGTLSSKNRDALEFNRKAQSILDELSDSSKTFTADEVNAKSEEAATLKKRAQIAAQFTPDAEVERQLLEQMSPEAVERSKKVAKSLKQRYEDLAERSNRDFGDIKTFLEVATGRSPLTTDEQKRNLEDNRLMTRAIVGTTGDISGGEFLLPLTQVGSIFSLSNVQQGILQRARMFNVPGRTLRIPYLIQSDVGADATYNRPMAGQIANITIVGEASTGPQRQPRFGQRLITVYKYLALTQVSNEMLADDFTGELPPDFINAIGQQSINKLNEDLTIDGTGTGQPFGALQPGAYNLSVPRTTTGAIKAADIFAMYDRHTHGPKSCWMVSRRCVSQLMQLTLGTTSLVTWIRNLNEPPMMLLMGYPVIISDILPTMGSTSDIALVNGDFYAAALRQALTVELSRDFAFDQDLTTYRFFLRGGGITLNDGKYAYKYTGTAGVDEHAPFVYLAA